MIVDKMAEELYRVEFYFFKSLKNERGGGQNEITLRNFEI